MMARFALAALLAASLSFADGEGRARADSLWQLRGDPAQARLALEAYRREAAQQPGDYALWARLSRAGYLVARYVEKDRDARAALLLAGVDAAKHALDLLPGWRDEFAKSKSEKKAAAKIGKDGVEALYWYAANLGLWAGEQNILKRLANKGRLEAMNRRVLELEEGFFYGGPHRFFGALPTKVPGGNLEESRIHFMKALSIAPDYFATRTLFAELYAVKAKDKALFETQLEYVVKADPNALPEAAPENGYEKEIARGLLARTAELFP